VSTSGLSEEARGAWCQLAQFGQLKTKGNSQSFGVSSMTERREIHRESTFRWNKTRTRRSCAPLLEGTRQRPRRSCAQLQKIDTEKGAAGGSLQTLTNWLRFPARPHLGTRPRTKRLLSSLSPSRERDIEPNSFISALETRTPSAAHKTIESAAANTRSVSRLTISASPTPPAHQMRTKSCVNGAIYVTHKNYAMI
jgi:hypothetical protein